MIASVPIRIIASYSEPLFVRINFTHETRHGQIFGNLHHRRSLAVRRTLDHEESPVDYNDSRHAGCHRGCRARISRGPWIRSRPCGRVDRGCGDRWHRVKCVRLRPGIRLLRRICAGLLWWIRAILWLRIRLSASVSPLLRVIWRSAIWCRRGPCGGVGGHRSGHRARWHRGLDDHARNVNGA